MNIGSAARPAPQPVMTRDLMVAVLAARPAAAHTAQQVADVATLSPVDAEGHVDVYA